MPVTAYIALGSNLGDRHDFLERALQMLRDHPAIEVGQVSSYHDTEPVGGPQGQGRYLNGAAELRTDLAPRQLLHVLLDIEQRLGRVRTEKDAARIIDLDLLFYGDQVLNEPDLILPHPRLHERLFVLQPLCEIAPKLVHPVLNITALHLMAIAGFRGLRAVVTGSSSGIGNAIALELAAAGADVIIHGRRADAVSQTVEQVERCQVKSRPLLADLRDPDDCHRLVRSAWDAWGRIDIWINNAGADVLTGEAAHWPFDRKLAELWAVDVQATMLLSREVGQRMKEAGGGVILNMGWDQAETGMEGDSGQLFAATKAAVMAFSKSLALTLAPTVRVNCLAPGWIQTAWGQSASTTWQERVLRETPLARWGAPADVAATARWLVSPSASFITGQTIRINGGAVR